MEVILQSTGAEGINRTEHIQNLWSGYGKIFRCYLRNSPLKTVVVKHIRLNADSRNPYGWNSGLSHQRKLKSYQIEALFYEHYSRQCDEHCRVAACLTEEMKDDEMILILEDLDTAGYPKRKSRVDWPEVELCIEWLANFHATFLGVKPEGLWQTGTYWHLETRPDELQALRDLDLKGAASEIDQLLKQSPFQTLVHGDAKLSNFCFSADGRAVAAVDFQYVGGGCGMKDLAYFIGSCMTEENCEVLESQILNSYFIALQQAFKLKGKVVDFDALESNWRSLYHTAWTDFHRFLKGWSPGDWKPNSYSERVMREVIAEINQR